MPSHGPSANDRNLLGTGIAPPMHLDLYDERHL
jgi:hypothetical protein